MKCLLLGILGLMAGLRAMGAVSESITSLSITNPGEYLIAADLLTNAPGTDREALQVRTLVRWSNDAVTASQRTTEYQLQLLTGPTPVSIVNESGNAGTVYRFTNSVTVPGTLGGNNVLSRTNFFSLRPTGRLRPVTDYQVRLELMAGGVSRNNLSNTPPRQFWHFTNLVSGDAAFNVLGAMEGGDWEKTYAIETVPDQESFEITNTFRVVRFDDFNAARTVANVPTRLSWQLQDTNGLVIPTIPSAVDFSTGMFNYEDTVPREPRDRTVGRVISFRPLQQLDSVNNRYRVTVTLSFTNVPGQPAEVASTFTNASSRLRHFSGTLRFGEVTATLTNLIGEPGSVIPVGGPDYVNASLDGRAILDASPERDFDLSGPRTFRLRANGEASLASGSLSVGVQSGGDAFTNGNFRLRRATITLSPDGAVADVRIYFPAGFGLSTNFSTTQRLESQVTFQDVGLDSALEPRTNLVLTTPFAASTESKPMLISGDRLTWSRSAHRFTITPSSTFPAIGTRFFPDIVLRGYSNSLASSEMATKRSNDGYYSMVDGFVGSIFLTASAQGIAQLTYTASFRSGSFQPHFPAGPSIVWTNGGRQEVDNNSVTVGSNSVLEGVSGIVQAFPGNCAGCDGGATFTSLSLVATNRVLSFTRDGGLIALRQPGSGLTQSLRWGFSTNTGAYAHRASNVTELSFHMPGHFLRGVDDTSAGANGPGVVHLTGVAATNMAVIERPLTSGYDLLGRADYAGINVRSPMTEDGGGLDTIAGTPVSFRRTVRAKYYVRQSGVTGVHEAVPGSFDSTLSLVGYPFTVDNYGLSFRDSLNLESRTEGSVRLPFPANITLPFKELRLTCPGGLESAELASSSSYRHLEYWNADILPQSMRFESKPGDECDPTSSYLVLGVRAHASHVTQPLTGTLGFFPNGSLIPPAFNLPGVNSRFDLPSQFRFAGPPGSGDWTLTPVSQAYFTTNDLARAPNGHLSFAGKLNVPFFQDIKVHLHSGARTNGAGSGEIFVAGGWPVDGWEQSGKNYFNDAKFDAVNRGFPAGVNLVDYHGVTDGAAYRARARRTWLDVVDFDYPLAWDPALRQFRSWRTVTSSFLLLTATHQLTYLDPRQAILDVGQRYEGLPVVSLTHLLVDEASTGAGAATALRQVAGDETFSGLTNGLASADALLSDNPSRLVERLVLAGIDPVVNNLMSQLLSQWNSYKNLPPNQRAAFRNVASTTVKNHFTGGGGITDQVIVRLANLGVGENGLPGSGKLFSALHEQIAGVADGIALNADAFDGGANGAATIRQLVALSAPQFSASVAGPEVEAALAKNTSSFQQLRTMMLEARSTIASYNAGSADVVSEWKGQLESSWNNAASSLDAVAIAARDAVVDLIESYNFRVDDPFAGEGATELTARIRAEISDRLMGEPVIATVRTSIKQRLFDPNAAYRSAANSLFAQYNTVARDLISRSLVQVDNNFVQGLDTLAQYFEVSRLQGHAEIQDESLRQLRLDGRFKLKVPEDMAFNAYLEIKELNSGNTPEECLYEGGVATEVKFGATDVELDWISDGLRADVGTKITLVGSSPRGIAGSLQTSGPLEFAGFVVKQVGFALAFGENENYLAANARVKLGQSSEIAGGVFFGRACDMTPLVTAVVSVSPYLLDAVNPVEIFGQPPFTGAFVYGEGMFPVFSLGCLLEVRLIAGAGGWYFKEGPKFGGIIKAGVSGTVICVLSASGDITLIGSKQGLGLSSPMAFVGMAHVEGCFGIWPFEVCVDGSTSVKYVEGEGWDADEP